MIKKNVINIISLLALALVIFICRDAIVKGYFMLQDKYFPCTRSITYSIGNVDNGFGINEEDFLNVVEKSANVWNTSLNKNLLVYKKNGGELAVNLVYDKRQKTTDILKSLNDSMENSQDSYSQSKIEIDNMKNDFEQKKKIMESKILTLRDKNGRYSIDDINEIDKLRIELDRLASKINLAVDKLNKSVGWFNNQKKQYNNIGEQLGDRFEEGLYHVDNNGKYIDIYQFENKEKLERVLMHELGHALSLDHSGSPNDIMYEMNIGDNLELTENDINALKTYCEIK